MNKVIFTCHVETPLVMTGANGTTPEIRPPSIKGMLRFWWRALNGHLRKKELKEQEEIIFGSTAGKSKIVVRLGTYFERNKTDTTFLLPHKEGNRRSQVSCFSKNYHSFEIILLMKGEAIELPNNQRFTFKDLCNLFLLACTLGGFGKRSRRGFGSIIISSKKTNKEEERIIMPNKLEEICQLMGTHYKLEGDAIVFTNAHGRPSAYPFIKKIEFGRVDANPIYNIINAAHQVKEADYKASKAAAERDNRYDRQGRPDVRKYAYYDNALGNGGRLASPIYVSVIPDEHKQRIILTTLHTVPEKGRFTEEHEVLQEAFKDKLK